MHWAMSALLPAVSHSAAWSLYGGRELIGNGGDTKKLEKDALFRL